MFLFKTPSICVGVNVNKRVLKASHYIYVLTPSLQPYSNTLSSGESFIDNGSVSLQYTKYAASNVLCVIVTPGILIKIIVLSIGNISSLIVTGHVLMSVICSHKSNALYCILSIIYLALSTTIIFIF